MLPKPLLYTIVVIVTLVWAFGAIYDVLSDTYDAQGLHLIFGGIVGGLIGLAKRDSGDGK